MLAQFPPGVLRSDVSLFISTPYSITAYVQSNTRIVEVAAITTMIIDPRFVSDLSAAAPLQLSLSTPPRVVGIGFASAPSPPPPYVVPPPFPASPPSVLNNSNPESLRNASDNADGGAIAVGVIGALAYLALAAVLIRRHNNLRKQATLNAPILLKLTPSMENGVEAAHGAQPDPAPHANYIDDGIGHARIEDDIGHARIEGDIDELRPPAASDAHIQSGKADVNIAILALRSSSATSSALELPDTPEARAARVAMRVALARAARSESAMASETDEPVSPVRAFGQGEEMTMATTRIFGESTEVERLVTTIHRDETGRFGIYFRLPTGPVDVMRVGGADTSTNVDDRGSLRNGDIARTINGQCVDGFLPEEFSSLISSQSTLVIGIERPASTPPIAKVPSTDGTERRDEAGTHPEDMDMGSTQPMELTEDADRKIGNSPLIRI